MYCGKCGKKINDDSVFCEFCGALSGVNSTKVPNDQKNSIHGLKLLIILMTILAVWLGVFACIQIFDKNHIPSESDNSMTDAASIGNLEEELPESKEPVIDEAEASLETSGNNTNDIPALNAEYNKRLLKLEQDGAASKKINALFDEWVNARYPTSNENIMVELNKKEKEAIIELEYITSMVEFCDTEALTDRDLLDAATNYYLYADVDPFRYGFSPVKFDEDSQSGLVSLDTMQSMLINVFGKALNEPGSNNTNYPQFKDGVYYMGIGDAGEAEVIYSVCKKLEKDTYLIIFDGYDPYEEVNIKNVSKMVVKRMDASAFLFNVLARSACCWDYDDTAKNSPVAVSETYEKKEINEITDNMLSTGDLLSENMVLPLFPI